MRLQDGEKLLYKSRPRNAILGIWFFSKVLVSTAIFAFFSFWSFGFFGGMYNSFYADKPGVLPVKVILDLFPYILPLFAIFALIYVIFLVATYRYYITNKRVVFEGGILLRKKTNIHYHKITDTTVSRSIFDQLLGISNLEVQTAGMSYRGWGRKQGEVAFVGLADAEHPAEIINKQLRLIRKNK